MRTDFEKVFPKMTPEEREEYMWLSMCGQWDRQNNIVLMGSVAYERVMKYQQEMIDKYLPEILRNKEKVVTLKNKSINRNQQTWKKSWKKQ